MIEMSVIYVNLSSIQILGNYDIKKRPKVCGYAVKIDRNIDKRTVLSNKDEMNHFTVIKLLICVYIFPALIFFTLS